MLMHINKRIHTFKKEHSLCICQCDYTTKPRDPYSAIWIAWLSGNSIESNCS
jgi:hypothetical protein